MNRSLGLCSINYYWLLLLFPPKSTVHRLCSDEILAQLFLSYCASERSFLFILSLERSQNLNTQIHKFPRLSLSRRASHAGKEKNNNEKFTATKLHRGITLLFCILNFDFPISIITFIFTFEQLLLLP